MVKGIGNDNAFDRMKIVLVLNLTWQVCCYMTPDHCCLTLAGVASA